MKSFANPTSVGDFVQALLFNYVVGATDAHAKNYALLHPSGHNAVLAPLFDVASALPYKKPGTHRGPWKTAMTIGGENRIGWLRRTPLEKFASRYGLSFEKCREIVLEYTSTVMNSVESVFDEAADMIPQLGASSSSSPSGSSNLRERLVPKIMLLGQATLANIDKPASAIAVPDLSVD